MNYILCNENAIFYEISYSCDNAIYIKLGSDKYFVTDARYTIEAKENIVDVEVIESKDLITDTVKILRRQRIKSIIFDPLDWNVYEFNRLKSKVQTYFLARQNFSQLKRSNVHISL